MYSLNDFDCLVYLSFLSPLLGSQRRERVLERRPVEDAVDHGCPRGSGDQIGPGVDPPLPFRGYSTSGDTHEVIESTGVQCHDEKICSSLSTACYNLFGTNGVLESLIHLNFDASLGLLLLRTVSGDDLLGFSEVGSDGLWIPEP